MVLLPEVRTGPGENQSSSSELGGSECEAAVSAFDFAVVQEAPAASALARFTHYALFEALPV